MYPSVMRLEVCDLSKPISGGRWFNDVKDKDLFDPDEKERKKAWDDVVKWMKSARGQRALDDDKAHEDEALDKGNYRKVNEAEDDADAEDAAETAIAALDELAGALDPEYEDQEAEYDKGPDEPWDYEG